ncbi:alpha/beta fold hydrolase, partial [bacterium]|nr:alpha/beta fold hydrolase [bacterium]
MSRLAPGPSGRAAARLFTYSHGRRQLDAQEALWLRDATPFELDCDGRTLAAWSWGDGPTVLLHHGWGGRGAQLGAFAAPLVAAGFSVVTYDAPAHGASPGRFTNGVEFARTIAEASRQLHGLHAVVAHSLGCLATAYALRRPLPIDRLVFVAPPAGMSTHARQFAGAAGFPDPAPGLMLAPFQTKLRMDWVHFPPDRLAATARPARRRRAP